MVSKQQAVNNVRESNQPAKEIAEVKRVPIDEIFTVEFKACELPEEMADTIREAYEHYVKGIMDCVRDEWPDEEVSSVDEKKLFTFLTEVFVSNFKANYKKDMLLSDSVQINEFNCYSSSVLMADVLTRLGKDVEVLVASSHVLVVGSEYAFETTAESPEDAVWGVEDIVSNFSNMMRGEVNWLLATAYNWSGVRVADKGMYGDAISFYEKAIQINPNEASTWNNKGNALYALGRYADALESHEKALELDPHDPEVWSNKGSALYALDRKNEAIDAYNTALELDPDNPGVWINKGNALYGLDRKGEALDAYSKALELNPEDARAWRNKGRTLHDLGRYEEGENCFEKARFLK